MEKLCFKGFPRSGVVLRDFRDPGSSRTGVAEIPFSVRGNLSRILFSEGCGTTFVFREVVDTILLFVKEACQKRAGGDDLENRVEKLRKERGLKQEEFAKAIRVSRQTVSSIETGKYNPSLDLAFTIADFFGMTIEEIFIHKGGANNEKELSE